MVLKMLIMMTCRMLCWYLEVIEYLGRVEVLDPAEGGAVFVPIQQVGVGGGEALEGAEAGEVQVQVQV